MTTERYVIASYTVRTPVWVEETFEARISEEKYDEWVDSMKENRLLIHPFTDFIKDECNMDGYRCEVVDVCFDVDEKPMSLDVLLFDGQKEYLL